MKHLILCTAAAIGLGTMALAEQPARPRELSAPIVAFTPLLVKNADALSLTEDQRAALKDWLATMPAKRKAIEAEALTARAALRAAIITGAPQEQRQSLADEVGRLETQLVLMRSACTDHWRAVLSPEQFAQLLTLAGPH
ncbi:Spy/CpxP family protein refolding chaperone [Actibacterium ureilyticum]|uniref:Spy/CpxP family protein refolding chaperone n=1 Tax=Actibacterium ureilyticum TaxID=1590614 RepID=UPI000BAAC5C5|nr:Spy/CpxP family protein refolding chaperone [Actibacterium ureilyticum]